MTVMKKMAIAPPTRELAVELTVAALKWTEAAKRTAEAKMKSQVETMWEVAKRTAEVKA
ncbi:hypothetical protein ACFY2T_41405 [Streptomyces sp. NPDC001260]|uniref:hypothetical protein n=1 Tax=Streptomyces sp. NPDC001260 TaxID=3364551 RepID=UPI00367B2902